MSESRSPRFAGEAGWSCYGFTAGDLAHISANQTGAGTTQIGVVLRRNGTANNFEFATVPEYSLILLMFMPILSGVLKRLKQKRF